MFESSFLFLQLIVSVFPGEADGQGAGRAPAGPGLFRGVGHVRGASLLRLRHGAGQEQGNGAAGFALETPAVSHFPSVCPSSQATAW